MDERTNDKKRRINKVDVASNILGAIGIVVSIVNICYKGLDLINIVMLIVFGGFLIQSLVAYLKKRK
ncbi:MAG: hypothetical protein ACRDD2_11235 [Sarcina sp.]